jgi:predicted MPP superfamily phosphohydrolase
MPVLLAVAPFALSSTGRCSAPASSREKVTVPVAGARGWRGARIVQLSDLHAGGTSRAAPATRGARGWIDLLVVTGDIAQLPGVRARAAEAMRRSPRHGVFACLGNHDFWAGPDAVEDEPSSARVRVLRRGLLLERNGEGSGSGRRRSLEQSVRSAALSGRPEGTATVLLSHQPTWPPRAGRRAAALGHTRRAGGAALAAPVPLAGA